MDPKVKAKMVHGIDARYDAYLSDSMAVSMLFQLARSDDITVKIYAIKSLCRIQRQNPFVVVPGLKAILDDVLQALL